jgi:hypothetical protein
MMKARSGIRDTGCEMRDARLGELVPRAFGNDRQAELVQTVELARALYHVIDFSVRHQPDVAGVARAGERMTEALLEGLRKAADELYTPDAAMIDAEITRLEQRMAALKKGALAA